MTDLRFVEHPGIFTDLCGIVQYGVKYTHVDAKTSEGTYLGALLLGGVQERKLDYDGGKFTHETFVHLNMTPEQETKFFARLRSHVGQPYDPIAILYFFGPFSSHNWHDPGAWECTSYIADGLIFCGWLPENKVVPACRMTPRDLLWITSTIASMAGGGADVA
jgi:hypothetical protein